MNRITVLTLLTILLELTACTIPAPPPGEVKTNFDIPDAYWKNYEPEDAVYYEDLDIQ